MHDGSLTHGRSDQNPTRILSDVTAESVSALMKLVEGMREMPEVFPPDHRRAMVFAETDDHISGWVVPPTEVWYKQCCEWLTLCPRWGGCNAPKGTPKRPKEWTDWGCFCQKKIRPLPAQIKTMQATGMIASIAFEAMDVQTPGIRPSPIPFTGGYSDLAGGEAGKNLVRMAKTVTLNGKSGILAAWGTAWPKLDHMVRSRIEAAAWLEKTTIANRSTVPPATYHTVVAAHKFILCPTGGGVQSPKLFEAFLLLTIPIVERPGAAAYVALAELGWPIAVVDSWEEVTEEQMKKWWVELSPLLERSRWMLLTHVWWAFTTFPCPISDIGEFLDYLIEGQPET
jgi:hypothetical protein